MERISEETTDRAIALYRSGKSYEEVAQITGHCKDTIRRAFKRRNEPSHPRNWRKFGRDNSRYHDGWYYASGYIRIIIPENHPLAFTRTKNGSVFQHRLVMMEHLGRLLRKDEFVHHINGVKTDNRLENLQLMQGNHGAGIVLCCADCGSLNITPSLKEVHRD